MRQDNQLIVLTHLSQLLTFITGFGGLLVPLVIWLTQKENVYKMDEQGKHILNFQISMLVYSLICIPLILALGLGIVGLLILCFLSFIYPIINAIKASHGETPKYPLSLNFIS
ncbi:DUF4870 domain-containing protein [Psychroserpens ponticola]|uniref:DUF4870 domain-containing protein n=1 Tax=Psychroserpens ponticola TaxID=2932268 RepID=A0ABY7S1X4_9FLAO|nr:DUF4870 domain-containing protein [Psychroserpens ponticola]WCO03383.1 DUF4870 domain-containing protein [Psychroserpens ponticola]